MTTLFMFHVFMFHAYHLPPWPNHRSIPHRSAWQHRIGALGGADDLAHAFVESISYDRRMYKHDIAGK